MVVYIIDHSIVGPGWDSISKSANLFGTVCRVGCPVLLNKSEYIDAQYYNDYQRDYNKQCCTHYDTVGGWVLKSQLEKLKSKMVGFLRF